MRKSTKRKIRLILFLILILIIVVLVLFFNTDIFRTKRSAFLRYFNQTSDALDVLSTDKFDEYNEKKENSSFIRNAQATIQSSNNVANSDILDKIKFNITEKRDDNNEKCELNFTINNKSDILENITAVKDKELLGIYCEDIANGYITIKNNDIKRIANDFGIENTLIVPNVIRNIKIKTLLETSKLEKKHLEKISEIIKNDVPNTAYIKDGQKKVTVNGVTYTSNVYRLTLNATDNTKLQIAILQYISKDSILMDYITSKFKLLGFDEQYTSINALNKLMNEKIDELNKNPEAAKELEIIIYGNKQKNLRMEISNLFGKKVEVEHKDEDNVEYSSISIDGNKYSLENNKDTYTFKYEDANDSKFGKKLSVEFNQTGSASENDIKNSATINYQSGIKSITYKYNDTVNFTDDIGKVTSINSDDTSKIILNDYSDEDLKSFFKTLKEKINDVYAKKGASIGINLDKIFE